MKTIWGAVSQSTLETVGATDMGQMRSPATPSSFCRQRSVLAVLAIVSLGGEIIKDLQIMPHALPPRLSGVRP